MSTTIDKPDVLIPTGDRFPPVGTVLFKCKSCGYTHWKVTQNRDTGYTYLTISKYAKSQLEKNKNGGWDRHIWCFQCGYHTIEPKLEEF